VESAAHYYRSLQENLKRLCSSRGYQAYFESWAPDQIDQQESLVEDLKNMFVQQTLDTRIEAALPTLAKIQQQGTKMKEAEIFENYMNRLSEGTWALPDTPEAYEKLQQLMTGELIVGADAMNATEQLYDLVGDDELFDILNDLADNDPRANIWDDSDVQRRLAELGVQTPQSTQAAPAAVPQDTAPPQPAAPPVAEAGPMGNDPDVFNYKTPNMDRNEANPQSLDKIMGKEFAARFSADYPPLGDAGGQTKYVDRTAPGIINKIKDKLGLDMPDPAYGPRPDERERLVKRYPAPAKESAEDVAEGFGDKNTSETRNNFINWITLNELDVYEDELLGYFDKFVDSGGSEYKAGEQAVNTWKARMKRDGESVRKPDDVAEGDDFGPGPGYPLDNQAGPIYAGPERIPNTGVPDKKNYKAPLSDKYGWKPGSAMGGWDAAGQQKYIDRTAPGIINKIKDKLGYDMPDTDYGPRPDETQRLVKRYPAPANENAELARMLQHAGVPLQEGVLTDSTGSTLEHIKDTYKRDIKDFTQTGKMSVHLFQALYDYYFDDMPYGARSKGGDPEEWVADRFAEDLGLNENLIAPIIMPVNEGSCNMTMEGEYCPEHGLAECMPASGGAVGMPYSMGEGVDDPINYNAAMTGSYYEGKETDIQEGDALLARIKSLALLR
jgi:hypothetical protein